MFLSARMHLAAGVVAAAGPELQACSSCCWLCLAVVEKAARWLRTHLLLRLPRRRMRRREGSAKEHPHHSATRPAAGWVDVACVALSAAWLARQDFVEAVDARMN